MFMRILMRNLFKSFIKEEKGQTLVEWIMILALILIIVIVALRAIGTQANKKSKEVEDALK